MLIGEVTEKTGLTKKAVRYYIEQGLLPTKEKDCHGAYRSFTEDEVTRLQLIRELRSLELPVSDIREILDAESLTLRAKLQKQASKLSSELDRTAGILHRLRLALDAAETFTPGKLLQMLTETNAETLPSSLESKLQALFPGPFGVMAACHFGAFVPDELSSEEQREAWKELVRWLDDMEPLPLPAGMEEWYGMLSDSAVRELAEHQRLQALELVNAPPEALDRIAAQLRDSIRQPGGLHGMASELRSAKESLAQSGYYNAVPGLMKRISPLYARYMARLEELQALVPVEYHEDSYRLP